jgi:hypothetical protein
VKCAVVMLHISLIDVEVGALHLGEEELLSAWGGVQSAVLPKGSHMLFLEFLLPTCFAFLHCVKSV